MPCSPDLTFDVMNILALDIGNTTIKLAVVSADSVIHLERSTEDSLFDRMHKLFSEHGCEGVVVSEVGELSAFAKAKLQNTYSPTFINSDSRLPFQNGYLTPKTLGIDRLALVAGTVKSKHRNQAHAALVIDAGTCITYDLLTADDKYLGGAISPGINMRYTSMHNLTARLPLLDQAKSAELVGKTTAGSMHSGVIHGTASEVDGMIARYREEYGALDVFLTGGDAELLAACLKNRFFAEPNLLLYGMYVLYTLNN